LSIVDSLANHSDLLSAYKTGFKQYKRNQQELKELISKADEARNRQDYEQFLFNELSEANLVEDEQQELEQELSLLNNAESIKRNLLNAISLINENEASANSILKEATNQLNAVEKFSTEIKDLNERLKSTLIEVKDIASELETLENNTQFNPEKLLT